MSRRGYTLSLEFTGNPGCDPQSCSRCIDHDIATFHLQRVAIIRAQELGLEIAIHKKHGVIFLAQINIAEPFTFEAYGIVGEIDHLDSDQVGDFRHLEREITFNEDHVGWFHLNGCAAWFQVMIGIMAGSGIDKIVARNLHFPSVTQSLQAFLEHFKMACIFANGSFSAQFAIDQEIIHFKSGDLLSCGGKRSK